MQIAMLAVYAATLAGLVVLIVQTADVFTKVTTRCLSCCQFVLLLQRWLSCMLSLPHSVLHDVSQDGSTRRFQHNTTYIWNIAVGSICMAHITLILFACWRHAYSAYRSGKRW